MKKTMFIIVFISEDVLSVMSRGPPITANITRFNTDMQIIM